MCERLLVVGGGPGGAIRELLKHLRFSEITQVEIDGGIIELTKQYFPHIAQDYYNNDRVNIVINDIINFSKSNTVHYDLIIYDVSEPLPDSPAANLFSEKLISNIKDMLTPDGAMVSWAGSMGPLSSELAQKINQLWKKVFPYTERYLCHPQSYGTSWLTVVRSNSHLGLSGLSIQDVDKYCANQIEGTLKLFDGITHQHMFALPKDVRQLLRDDYIDTKSDELISLEFSQECVEEV